MCFVGTFYEWGASADRPATTRSGGRSTSTPAALTALAVVVYEYLDFPVIVLFERTVDNHVLFVVGGSPLARLQLHVGSALLVWLEAIVGANHAVQRCGLSCRPIQQVHALILVLLQGAHLLEDASVVALLSSSPTAASMALRKLSPYLVGLECGLFSYGAAKPSPCSRCAGMHWRETLKAQRACFETKSAGTLRPARYRVCAEA